MRKVSLLGLVAAMIAVTGALAGPAEASDRHPAGWGRERTVVHYGYYPRYRHVYATHSYTDPYAYRYEPRGYYPYYNSGYWRPAHEMRKRGRRIYTLPPYYQGWGYPDRTYRHRAWHRAHHGRIRHGHW
jgi:hypothetical protein